VGALFNFRLALAVESCGILVGRIPSQDNRQLRGGFLVAAEPYVGLPKELADFDVLSVQLHRLDQGAIGFFVGFIQEMILGQLDEYADVVRIEDSQRFH